MSTEMSLIFGDKCVMHTWKYTTRIQKISFSVHMEISSSSEVLRMAGWEEGKFVSSRSLDQLDEGDWMKATTARGGDVCQGKVCFCAHQNSHSQGHVSRGGTSWPHDSSSSLHMLTHRASFQVSSPNPKVRESERWQKYKNYAQSFNKHFFLLLQPETWGTVSDLSLWRV